MARVRLADVAARARVSTATASHVLRGARSGGTIRVSESTRAAVRQAADELGYVPSAAARGLAAGSSGRVAIMVPYLYNPYFAYMAQTLILALEERGMTTTLRLAHDAEAERDAVLGRTTGDVDGMLVCPHFLSAEMLGEKPGLPVVQVGGAPTEGIDCVVMGEEEGMRSAVRHVLEQGRRRIAYVADPWIRDLGSARFTGYRTALAEVGLEVDPDLLIEGADWDRRGSGLDAMVGLLRSGTRFDAAVCVNDAVAVGALRAISRAGLRVPEDVAITGFDDTVEVAFTSPPLTSVDPGVQQMAELAVEMLVARLEGSTAPAVRVSAPPRLIVRASTRG